MAEINTLIDILKYSTEYLEKKGIEQGRLTAEKIIAQVLDLPRLSLYLNYDRPLIKEEKEKIKEALVKRGVQRMPLQYIFNEEYFYGYRFFVDERVLIPRPDTERLVESVLTKLKETNEPKIIDIGTGSGAIAIALAKEREDALILGVDISDGALDVAELNKKNNNAKNVKFKKSDVFSEVSYKDFDAVVSNPPYIDKEEYNSLSDEVRKYEPQNALTDNGDGMFFYKEISKKALSYLKKGGLLAFEAGYNQAANIAELLAANNYVNIEIIKDFNGIERVVTGIKNV